MNAFAAQVQDTLGRVDIIVNNAEIVPFADIDDVTFELWTQTFSVNVNGAFLTTKAFLEDVKESAAGRVINITSGSYWTSPEPFVTYVPTKGAINGLTHVLARNLGKYDVTVNAVAPGLVPTATALRAAGEEFFDLALQMQDLKRQQTPGDVASTVAFLASDDAAFITGQIIAVDGGLTRR
jgi:NAD(P)-dependent dehydrogenase (short-subunit alcohol dehydrogenase family)